MLKTNIARMRVIGFLEGLSYVLLVGIAMPLKYWADMPEAVSWPGRIHGFLFVAYVFQAIIVKFEYNWSLLRTFWVMLASLVPFGTFVADAKIFKHPEE